MTFKEKIDAGQFVITAELGPPQSANGNAIRKKAKHFKEGIDGVNITDNQTAIVRLSSIAAAKILIDEGLEPVIQMTCRDRNRIAIQSDLLGADALGIHNVLCLTGDYPTFGNHPESKTVFDLDSVQLIAMTKQMNEGFFISGDMIKTPLTMLIGGAANPFAEPLEMRLIRLEKKIKAGADFIQTQPLFHKELFETWMNEVVKRNLHKEVALQIGVMPVKSARALEYMQLSVPGMMIDPLLIKRMQAAGDPKEEGIQMAVEWMHYLKSIPEVRGIHLMPLMWESITPELLQRSGFIEKVNQEGK